MESVDWKNRSGRVCALDTNLSGLVSMFAAVERITLYLVFGKRFGGFVEIALIAAINR